MEKQTIISLDELRRHGYIEVVKMLRAESFKKEIILGILYISYIIENDKAIEFNDFMVLILRSLEITCINEDNIITDTVINYCPNTVQKIPTIYSLSREKEIFETTVSSAIVNILRSFDELHSCDISIIGKTITRLHMIAYLHGIDLIDDNVKSDNPRIMELIDSRIRTMYDMYEKDIEKYK